VRRSLRGSDKNGRTLFLLCCTTAFFVAPAILSCAGPSGEATRTVNPGFANSSTSVDEPLRGSDTHGRVLCCWLFALLISHPEFKSVFLLLRAPRDRHHGVAELRCVLDAQVSQAAHPFFNSASRCFVAGLDTTGYTRGSSSHGQTNEHPRGEGRLRATYLTFSPAARPAEDGKSWHSNEPESNDRKRELRARGPGCSVSGPRQTRSILVANPNTVRPPYKRPAAAYVCANWSCFALSLWYERRTIAISALHREGVSRAILGKGILNGQRRKVWYR